MDIDYVEPDWVCTIQYIRSSSNILYSASILKSNIYFLKVLLNFKSYIIQAKTVTLIYILLFLNVWQIYRIYNNIGDLSLGWLIFVSKQNVTWTIYIYSSHHFICFLSLKIVVAPEHKNWYSDMYIERSFV